AAEALRTESSDILRMKLGDFMITAPVTVPADSTIQDAAAFMQKNNVSSLLIMDESSPRKVKGIVTDRDLRAKVVAIARDVS
ncbi:CBS domain-containing protein, partial [Bacteroides thetaiotaomicron]|uniref:CBS domain-containing protein n=1 Tax=Bacteroides thetaiotaomicron TaxID=818 RepID=UPI0019262CDD